MDISSKGNFSSDRSSRFPAIVSSARIGFVKFQIVLVTVCLNLSSVLPAGAASQDEQIATVKSQMNEAIFQVQHIVNQPV
jgi:hypothetical protein